MLRREFGAHTGKVVFEFALIVVGVLTALAVDGWVGRQKQRAAEAQYLEGLASDLAYNVDHFRSVLAALELVEAQLQAAERILQAEETQTSAAERLATLYRATSFSRPAPLDDTYRELLSTGNLRLIRSGDLRRQVVAYHRDVDRWAVRNFDLIAENRLPFRNTVRSVIPIGLQDAIASSCDGNAEPQRCELPFPDDTVRAVLNRLVSKPGLLESLNLWGSSLRTGQSSIARLSEPTTLLQGRIAQEMDSR